MYLLTNPTIATSVTPFAVTVVVFNVTQFVPSGLESIVTVPPLVTLAARMYIVLAVLSSTAFVALAPVAVTALSKVSVVAPYTGTASKLSIINATKHTFFIVIPPCILINPHLLLFS
jgi:hypothetical protein